MEPLSEGPLGRGERLRSAGALRDALERIEDCRQVGIAGAPPMCRRHQIEGRRGSPRRRQPAPLDLFRPSAEKLLLAESSEVRGETIGPPLNLGPVAERQGSFKPRPRRGPGPRALGKERPSQLRRAHVRLPSPLRSRISRKVGSPRLFGEGTRHEGVVGQSPMESGLGRSRIEIERTARNLRGPEQLDRLAGCVTARVKGRSQFDQGLRIARPLAGRRFRSSNPVVPLSRSLRVAAQQQQDPGQGCRSLADAPPNDGRHEISQRAAERLRSGAGPKKKVRRSRDPRHLDIG